MKRIKSSKIITPAGIQAGYVYYENGKIASVTEQELPFESEIDAGENYVAPGFIDVHTHGGAGCDFAGMSVEETVKAAQFHLSHGTTSIYPTISAAPFEKMANSARTIKKAKTDGNCKANIMGVHLEGPYLSKDQCGAQSTDFIIPPDPKQYEPFVAELGDAIGRWSYAPENDKDGAFCKFLTEHNIVASAGHTNAEYEDMLLAFENGLRNVTHLFSCTSTITRKQGFRHLGVIESAFLNDDVFVEIIADGKHLPPELIRLIVKIKGNDKVMLVTDSLSLAGTKQMHGFMEATEYVIEDGVCKLMDRSAFAGSIATADRLVRVCVKEVGLDIADAVKMMTANPAAAMGLKTKGALAEGMDADIVVFDEDINIQNVLVSGNLYNPQDL